jgi:hypothetical protein
MSPTKKKIDKVTIRMYCMGTGDCFVLKFFSGAAEKFTMLIDCGSCSGGPKDFEPYIKDLAEYVNHKIDLLVVTHEHEDHVNGFHKCKAVFESIKFKAAWFAWTENPKDPDGKAKELLKKRKKLRLAFANAMSEFEDRRKLIEENFKDDGNYGYVKEANEAFLQGLKTLADINLPASDSEGSKESLAGMKDILELLQEDQADVTYHSPGEIKRFSTAPGLKFYVLGPPSEPSAVFKDGKEGKDVYKKHFSLNQSMLSANSFVKMGNELHDVDLPFDRQYATDFESISTPGSPIDLNYLSAIKPLYDLYNAESEKWRRIDFDWLAGVGSLALRLNSHINNTSLVLAIESEESGNVLLFPGDAEFGNWESWHLIEGWQTKGAGGKPLAEDLLSRTVFYKAGHHLSYNGTALERGINLMPKSEIAAMVSLDRSRISAKWKSTMPNKHLLQDLIKRCGGKVFIMSEKEIPNPPSNNLNPQALDTNAFKTTELYKEYTFNI